MRRVLFVALSLSLVLNLLSVGFYLYHAVVDSFWRESGLWYAVLSVGVAGVLGFQLWRHPMWFVRKSTHDEALKEIED